MLSKRIVAIARRRAFCARTHSQSTATSLSKAWNAAGTQLVRAQFHSSRLLQAEVVKVPQMAESISEGTLKSWSKKVGDAVEADEEVATIETDKIDVTVNAPVSGTIVELLANEEDTVVVGQDLLKIEAGAGRSRLLLDPTCSLELSVATAPPKTDESPEELPPSSKKGDSEEPVDQQVDKSSPPPPQPSGADKQGGGIPSDGPKEEKKELKEDTKTSAKKEEAPAAPSKPPGGRNETRKYKDEVLKEHDVKLGFMSAFARACTLALRELPAVNASIEGDEIVYRDFVDLSVAVATPKGLVTPVVRNAESMGFLQIEKEIAALGKKAKDGKLSLEDMTGGTFTISNGGVFGSLFGTPIINLPQSAVLGMHTIKDRPVVVNGQIVIRPIMIVALTYDHRLLDGRDAVTFLVKVKEYIEDPRKMLLTPF
ncbi:hypothetical protein F5141DRAFT_1187494 [Pisolithus sp. B1]|nr:hypothetical protein F5141DRAFT_1187494 [Pisolithus sp. B1]